MDICVNLEHGEAELSKLPISRLAEYVLGAEGCPEGCEVSLSFVDDDEMARLNEQFRGKSGPTDVLSFECDGLEDGFACEDAGGVFELGDVIVATDVAKRQTAQFGTSFEGEVSLLLVHGLLHLCGYDHIEDAEAELMEAREAELLRGWASERGMELSQFGEFNGSGALVRGEH